MRLHIFDTEIELAPMPHFLDLFSIDFILLIVSGYVLKCLLLAGRESPFDCISGALNKGDS